MSRYRTTLILVLAFLLVLALYVLLKQRTADQAAATPESSTIVFPQFTPENVTRVDLQQQGKHVIYTVDSQGKWSLQDKPEQTPAQNTITDQLVQLGNLSAQQTITESQYVANLAQYGLSSSALKGEIDLKNGTKYTFLLGDKSRVGDSYYLKKENEQTVYVVPSAAVEDLLVLLNPQAAPSLTPGATPALTPSATP